MEFEKMEKHKKIEGERRYKQDFCNRCGKFKRIFSQGVCNACYIKFSMNSNKVLCKKCNEMKAHFAKGYCHNCYVVVNNKKRYKNDPEFRRNMKENTKKWQEENKDKVAEYARKYNRKNPRNRIERNKIGLICPTCVSLIKVAGQSHRGKRKIKCPHCRIHDHAFNMDKCKYDRFTDKILEITVKKGMTQYSNEFLEGLK